MGKVHKSLRIDADLADAVGALKADGESEASAYARVIRAGLDALDHATDGPGEGKEGEHRAPTPTGERDGAAVAQELTEHIADLRAENAALRHQLDVKDGQIEAMTSITRAAQSLHAMSETKAIESAEGKRRRGLWARLRGRPKSDNRD